MMLNISPDAIQNINDFKLGDEFYLADHRFVGGSCTVIEESNHRTCYITYAFQEKIYGSQFIRHLSESALFGEYSSLQAFRKKEDADKAIEYEIILRMIKEEK